MTISAPEAVDYSIPADNTIPLYGVIGGGTATFDNGKYIWLEVPEDAAPDAYVGGEVSKELSFSPINDRACAQEASIPLLEKLMRKVPEGS